VCAEAHALCIVPFSLERLTGLRIKEKKGEKKMDLIDEKEFEWDGIKYKICVEEDGLNLKCTGYLNDKPVTLVIVKSIFLAIAESLNKTAKNYETSTAKAIKKCGIKDCLTLEEAYKAISSNMPKTAYEYQDLICAVEDILKEKPKFIYTDKDTWLPN